ncbi:unnamed protein product [Lupinus luteus]|uniref:Reverse transcriptase zinc-binding domain-containing protein n=1 Tax=Lupinus luteus TaxID=3873 RepID=A0AAV1YPA3_LUPLU
MFKAKPKKLHLQPIADRISQKLASWKGACLSIMGRVELVRSVIHSRLAYSFHFYAWPVTLLKELDRKLRNFIWAGDTIVKKICTVAWQKICAPINMGGLGLKSIKFMNKATLLKLSWLMLSSDQEWASFYRLRFGNNYNLSTRYFKSSIWHIIKQNWSLLHFNSIILVGDGKSTNFWKDNWLGVPLIDYLQIPKHLHCLLHAKVADFLQGPNWLIPSNLMAAVPDLAGKLSKVITTNNKDKFIWMGSSDEQLSSKDAYLHLSPVVQQSNLFKKLWSKAIPPSKSFITWRWMHQKLPTDDNLMQRGCQGVSMCSLCCNNVES